MTTSVVVSSILLAANQQLRVEERTVSTRANLIDGRGVKIDEERTGDMLATAGLGEEGLEGARVTNVLGVGVETTIGAEAVLEEVATERLLAGYLVGRDRSSSSLRVTNSSQAALPSWVPAWPMWR